MELGLLGLPDWIAIGLWSGYLGVLLLALRYAPWRLLNGVRAHVFLGFCVSLVLLWSMRAQVNDSLHFHLLGVTALTLVCGWALAVIGSSLSLLGVWLNQQGDWSAFAVNALLTGVVPVLCSQGVLRLVRHYLPKNFFIYVLVNGFFTGGLVALLSGYLAAILLAWWGGFTFSRLDETFLPFFPMMFLPEAFLNGWIITVLVVNRPHWVYSFSDEQYINGK